MLILLSLSLLLITALTLFILRTVRPNFRFFWLIGSGGAFLALVSVFLWKLDFPVHFSSPAWKLHSVFSYTPGFLADGLTWPYALSLTALCLAIILTAVVRTRREPYTWVGTLILTAFGILAVTAGNPITIVLAWAALDLAELVTGLVAVDADKSEGVVIAFTARLAGILLVLWVSLLSTAAGSAGDFQSIPAHAGVYLLLAVAMRLGVLPLHLPFNESALRRGFGTGFRLVSAASSLALLGHIPASTIVSPLTPFLLILTALSGLYAGWMWLRASDELSGRPFWLIGMGSLAVASALAGNPTGSVAWGNALILAGGLIFLYSSRQTSILWLPYLGILGLSAWPFTITSSGWQGTQPFFLLFWLTHLPGQILMIAGFIRHSLHPGETALESQPRWSKVIYPLGLGLLSAMVLLLGLWGWQGAGKVGLWWAGLPGVLLAAGLAWMAFKLQARRLFSSSQSNRWMELLRLNWLYSRLWGFYQFLVRISDGLSAQLEGDGGILWSLLILALLVSLLTRTG